MFQTIKQKFLGAYWGYILSKANQAAQFAVTAKPITDDNSGWSQVNSAGRGPMDRDWADYQRDLSNALKSWRENFLVRQIVRLTTSFVVGDGIKIMSKNPKVNEFLDAFWNDPDNEMDDRLSEWCNELTRAGELYPVLHTSSRTGMSHVRVVPAACIMRVETAPNDYENEIGYTEISVMGPNGATSKTWKSARTAKTYISRKPPPMMLHFSINKPVGATRGEGDLTPILAWVLRYVDWLKGRVKLNRLRSTLTALVISIRDRNQVVARQKFYEANPPGDGGITVIGPDEEVKAVASNIGSHDASGDGKVLRLAVSAGSGIPLWMLAEADSANRSSATMMGDPVHRHYRMRQRVFCRMLIKLVKAAWRRYEIVNGLRCLDDLELSYEVSDLSRGDNKFLAEAGHTIAQAFVLMKQQGWVDDETATRLIFKFTGEVLTHKELGEIMSKAKLNIPVPAVTTGDGDA
jgi:hypothetical protein